ncbi:type A2 lantipeptide [Streptomyces sp. F63]|uniref:type A2 lantipeptide n=1 Tax=Streptomyces sp. F63 TaxID=2824887 RepID=UPI001B37FC9C|nr:type A2 lantipeptide [Streptomyces sp. F63]MBQ0984713.1 type A2 lantipeptide [Streptomyces sp. F63]
MRNDFTPQVETREIDDADLDTVSGGIGVNVAPVLGAVDSVAPLSEGLGLVQDVTGLPTGQVTGLVAGL